MNQSNIKLIDNEFSLIRVDEQSDATNLKDLVAKITLERTKSSAELFQYISGLQENEITQFILVGLTAKHLNKRRIVDLSIKRTKHALQQLGIGFESSVWSDAFTELVAWSTDQKEKDSIVVRNHIKTTPLEISLIVACMDRKEHLVETIKSWKDISYIKEIIVIDYSSVVPLIEDPTISSLVEEKKIRLIRVNGETTFNLGRAYNLAFDFAGCDKILKIDCDHLCVDSSWLDRLDNATYDSHECYFIRGDWRFGHSLSGFLFCDRRDFVYYREDLCGWGFDDLDLARRITETKPRIKEVLWPDANGFIKHLPHNDVERTRNYPIKDKLQTNYDNRLICHQPLHEINRFEYTVKWNPTCLNVTYKPATKINEVFCVTLKDRENRWEEISKSIPNIRKFQAIDTRKNPTLCEQYGLTVRPSTVSYKIYFKGGNGAVGCYLSHYLIWQQIVKESIPYALITEDDIDTSSVNRFLNDNLINFNGYDLIQLNKRFSYIKPEHRLMFHGTESYAVSLEGAKKLIKATENPEYLEYVYHNEFPCVKETKKKRKIRTIPRIYEKNSIIAPADKFITMCCDPKCDPEVQLKCLNYPCIDINPNYAVSDIDHKLGHLWQLSGEQIENLIDELQLDSDTY
jgi:GR25 family glycosyltransferase involved in LPS biosynthesis